MDEAGAIRMSALRLNASHIHPPAWATCCGAPLSRNLDEIARQCGESRRVVFIPQQPAQLELLRLRESTEFILSSFNVDYLVLGAEIMRRTHAKNDIT